MKNKIKIIFAGIISVAVVFLTSCEKETTQGFDRITYYPTLELLGKELIFLDKGSTYQDAGVKGLLNGQDISSEVTINSNVDTGKPGIYQVTYVATNEDGFSASIARTVYVVDPTPSVLESGIYIVQEGTERIASKIQKYDGYPIIIFQMEPGLFYISDFLGGYYDQLRGYGPNYAASGQFRLNADNTLTLVESHVIGWKDGLDGLENGNFDTETKTLSFGSDYAGMMFNVILKK